MKNNDVKMVELSNMVFIDVATFDDRMPSMRMSIELHNGRRQAEEIHKKVSKEIGISAQCQKYFALHEGKFNPKQVYKLNDFIEFPQDNLCLQKWCFDVQSERDILFDDPVALHLLYLQVKSYIKSGKIKPTTEETNILTGHENEGNKKEFVELCQQMRDYTSGLVRKCSLLQECSLKFYDLFRGSHVDLLIGETGLELIFTREDIINCSSDSSVEITDNESKDITHFIPWNLIRSWSHNCVTSSMKYEIRVRGQGFHYLMVKTEQAKYVLSLTMEMIKLMQDRADNPPSFHVSMIRKDNDITHWDNIMYNPGKTDDTNTENNNT